MAARSATWYRRPRRKPVAEYVCWSDVDRSNSSFLLCTWLNDWHEPDAASVPLISPRRGRPHPLLEKLCHRCSKCRTVWRERFDRPIDVTLLDQTYGGDKLTGAKLRNVRVTLPLGSVPAVIRVETLDLLAPYLDDGWLVGDVYLISGERLGGFRSVVDRYEVPMRTKFHKEWFKYGSARFGECSRCRVFHCWLTMGGSYILAGELPGPGIRLSFGKLQMERGVAERLDLFNRRLWPGGSPYSVPVHEDRLDPIPTPFPRTWEQLVESVRRNGDFPFDELGRPVSGLRKSVEEAEAGAA